MQCRPFETAGIAAYPTRTTWDAAAVEILDSVLTRWNLTPGERLLGGYSASVLRVERADGSPAVLKVGYPHEEAVFEAVGLQVLAGFAPEVYDQDPWAWALLLEDVRPGSALSGSAMAVDDGLLAGAALLRELGAIGPVAGVPALSTVVEGYVAVARARRVDQLERLDRLEAADLVRDAIDELEFLTGSGPSTAFVHGDYNPGNILRSADRWVVVDPKPMTGDPAYDLWPLIAQLGAPFDSGDARGVLASRLVLGADEAGIDPVRAARWCFARTGLNVSWYLEEQNLELAAHDARELGVWAAVRDEVMRAG